MMVRARGKPFSHWAGIFANHEHFFKPPTVHNGGAVRRPPAAPPGYLLKPRTGEFADDDRWWSLQVGVELSRRAPHFDGRGVFRQWQLASHRRYPKARVMQTGQSGPSIARPARLG
jgi:hypothetical protein